MWLRALTRNHAVEPPRIHMLDCSINGRTHLIVSVSKGEHVLRGEGAARMANDPEKLGKYDIVGKLGKGAMGRGLQRPRPVLNRYVAIKVIAESLDTDSDLVERFRREAKMAAQLNHPNIITIYDFVEEEGNLYIVMELLDGKDLKELIKGGTPLTVDQILGIMEQIADGLGFAHDSGMVHRDLKPANIHVTKKGQIKILDFGLVHEASSDMTKTGHVMGTPNYMSPEQVQGLRVDPRSDIFSLGAVFYELLTRKKPFSADSIHATMFKVVQGEREPLAQYTHLPLPLVTMVDRALDPNPDGRYNDGNALREHLRVVRRETTESLGADSHHDRHGRNHPHAGGGAGLPPVLPVARIGTVVAIRLGGLVAERAQRLLPVRECRRAAAARCVAAKCRRLP